MMRLEIKDISLSYNHIPVVKDVSFKIEPGQIMGLIGPNGCGKTSIIKALSRILELRSGQILLDGQEINRFSRNNLARLIGVVPQNPGLPDTFTVSEVVLLGRNPHLGFLRRESAHDLEIVRWAIEKTGISSIAERRLSALSGGERQRVTIARILAQEPRIILLDEPTANLDISHQVEILNLIKSLCGERKLGVLIALHDLNLAAQYCSHLLLLKNGNIYAKGSPDEVITAENIREVYGSHNYVGSHPENNLPMVLPGVRSLSHLASQGDALRE